MSIGNPAPRPCESCPYRRDVPSGVWSAEEYEKLPAYDSNDPTVHPIAVFQCHQNGPDDDRARMCAGWVGCHTPGHLLSLRIGAVTGHVDPSVFEYSTDVPLFSSGLEAAEHGMAEIEDPDEDACELIYKISDRRGL